MDVKYLKRVLIGFLTAVICIAATAYLIYHMSLSFGNNMETTVASYRTESKYTDCVGYIFRDELLLNSSGTGTVSQVYSDGTKVSIGSDVAEVYSSVQDIEITRKIADIDRHIKILKESSVGGSYSDVNQVNSKINQTVKTLKNNIKDGSVFSAVEMKDELLVQINRLQLITGTIESFDSVISELEAERSALKASLGSVVDTLYAPVSGYFYSDVDGGETLFTMDALDNMSVSSFNSLASQSGSMTPGGGTVGKLVTDYHWYIATKLTKLESESYDIGKQYNLTFKDNSDMVLSMSLESIIDGTDTEEAVLVFCCTDIPLDFDFNRCQNISIATKEYNGYYVPSGAVRLVDGAEGVYVLSGTTVKFKKIDVVYQGDGYLISAVFDTSKENYTEYLNLNENIIVQGKDLYDGKIIVG